MQIQTARLAFQLEDAIVSKFYMSTANVAHHCSRSYSRSHSSSLLQRPYSRFHTPGTHFLGWCLDVKSVYATRRIASQNHLMTCGGSQASFHYLMHLNILIQVRFPQTTALHVSRRVCTLPQPGQSWCSLPLIMLAKGSGCLTMARHWWPSSTTVLPGARNHRA